MNTKRLFAFIVIPMVLFGCAKTDTKRPSLYQGPNLCKEWLEPGNPNEQVDNYAPGAEEQIFPANLSNRGLTNDELFELIVTHPLRPLPAKLWLAGNDFTDAAIEKLSSLPFSRVGTIRAQSNSLTGASLSFFPNFPGLKELDLSSNPLFNVTVEQPKGGPLKQLSKLSLSQTGLSSSNLHILNRDWIPKVRDLDLSKNLLGPEGLRALTRTDILADLSSINLTSTGINTQSAIEFFSEDWSTNCGLILNLNGNPIGDAGIKALAKSRLSTQISVLGLVKTEITLNSVLILSRENSFPLLKRITLSQDAFNESERESLTHKAKVKGLKVKWR
jgi:hypothetical protein